MHFQNFQLKFSMYWYKKSAKQGDSNAQYKLGCFYEDGLGVNKDLVLAIHGNLRKKT